MTQAINSYNVLIDRFQTFANGHYMINAFTHGILPAIDEPKDKLYPWMHVLCSGIVQQAGQAEYSWTVYFFDLPRDKADAHENKREALSDCIRLAQDLIYEIDNGNVLFGDTVDLLPGAQIVPGIDEWTNTLTGVELTFTMAVPDDYDACAIPADFSVGSGTDTSTPGVSSLSFSESLNNTDGIVTLDNDEESPGNTKYYGTNAQGVKGWYTLTGGGGGGSVESVTGSVVDNTDPANPIIYADAAGAAAAALVSANGYTDSAVAGLLPANAPITGSTKTKITYDAKGLVTAGADAAIGDITGLTAALAAKLGGLSAFITSQVDNATTSEANVTGLSVAVEANATYFIIIGCALECSGATGIFFGHTYPTSTLMLTHWGRSFGSNTLQNLGNIYPSGTGTGLINNAFNAVAAATGYYCAHLVLRTTASGTYQLTFAAAGAAQTASVRAGSGLVAIKMT